MMRLYVCTNFKGIWPVGVCAIIVAYHEASAHYHLLKLLAERKLLQDDGWIPEFREISLDEQGAHIILDGEY